MKKIILIACVLFTVHNFAQSKLNNYKYILVPNQFEFQRTADRYQINSLTKFLFKKAGFTVFKSNESFPDDLAQNRCQALTTRIINSPNILSTRVTIELVDCYNNIVFTTRQGKSRLKDYRKGYNEAIRMAFKDIENANYQYIKPKNSQIAKVKKAAKVEKVAIKEKVIAQPKAPKVPLKKSFNPKKVERISANNFEITGKYQIGDYGVCTIVTDNKNFKILSGDENFEIAKIYKTSKANIFIVKWVAFKQPQLVQLIANGNLKMDTNKGIKEYYRI